MCCRCVSPSAAVPRPRTIRGRNPYVCACSPEHPRPKQHHLSVRAPDVRRAASARWGDNMHGRSLDLIITRLQCCFGATPVVRLAVVRVTCGARDGVHITICASEAWRRPHPTYTRRAWRARPNRTGEPGFNANTEDGQGSPRSLDES